MNLSIEKEQYNNKKMMTKTELFRTFGNFQNYCWLWKLCIFKKMWFVAECIKHCRF